MFLCPVPSALNVMASAACISYPNCMHAAIGPSLIICEMVLALRCPIAFIPAAAKTASITPIICTFETFP